jgi:antagonist of KipI
VLPVGRAHLRRGFGGQAGLAEPLELPDGGARVRVVPAVHRERFTDDAWGLLVRARFTVSPQSNRMGYRLDGPVLGHAGAADILSEAMPIGALQVPASGSRSC